MTFSFRLFTLATLFFFFSKAGEQCIYVINSDSSASSQKLDILCLDTAVFSITEVATGEDAYTFFSSIAPSTDMDSVWILISAALVFFMQTGFTMLEAGTVKVTNVQNILFKNLMDACVGTIAWYIFGHCIAYGDGESTNEFIGENNLVLSNNQPWVQWFGSWAFAMTSMTIVSGSVAERCTLSAYFLYTLVLSAFVYPILVHWIWSDYGWLSSTNSDAFVHVVDFAGCSVVHMVGGISGLLGAIFIGPRLYRFEDQKQYDKMIEDKTNKTAKERRKRELKKWDIPSPASLEDIVLNDDNGSPEVPTTGNMSAFQRNLRYLHERRQQTQLGNNVPFQVLGCFILWFGWYGFNCGATGGANKLMNISSKCAVTVTLSAAAGGITSALLSRTMEGYFSIPRLCNGILAGLVSITASCSFIDEGDAIAVGIIGCIFYFIGSYALEILGIDDPLDAFPVHGICGTWGMVAVALFGTSDGFEFAGYNSSIVNASKGYRLGAQLFAIFMVTVWVVFWIGSLFAILKYFGEIRVSQEVEMEGMDVGMHGGQAVDMRIAYNMGKVREEEYRANAFEKGHSDMSSGEEEDDHKEDGGVIELEEVVDDDNTARGK